MVISFLRTTEKLKRDVVTAGKAFLTVLTVSEVFLYF